MIKVTVPQMVQGFKDVSVTAMCWKDYKHIVSESAKQFYYKGKNKKAIPIPPRYDYWNFIPSYNTSTVGILGDQPSLYYWANYNINNNPNFVESWKSALGKDIQASIIYNSTITDGLGLILSDGDTVQVGESINFNFDNFSPNTSNIYWHGTGYTSDTPYGQWRANATYPSQICNSGNLVKSNATYFDAEVGKIRHINIYAPLSVNPPNKVLSFGEDPDPANKIDKDDEWSCPDPTKCSVLNPGTKTVNMYYTSTYGSYYYGWNEIGFACRSNDVPLHDKVTLDINGPLYTDTTGIASCRPANGPGCRGVFAAKVPNGAGITAGCYSTYPFYNYDTDKCYRTYTDYINSYHADENFSGPTTQDYYFPYKLRFNDSLYKIRLNAVADLGGAPTKPVVEGSSTVFINVESVYSAVSQPTSSVAKVINSIGSFMGSVIIAIKSAFAETQVTKFVYIFDWNNDGINTVASDAVLPGVKIYSGYTWTIQGDYTFKVTARNESNGKISEPTYFNVKAVEEPGVLSYPAPVPSGSFCTDTVAGGKKMTLSWNPVSGAIGYNVYKNNDVPVSKAPTVLSVVVPNYSSDSYYVRAYGPRKADTQNELTVSPRSIIVDSTNMRDAGNCYVPAVTPTGLKITDPKFYPNPSWADINDKCKFYGRASANLSYSDGTSKTLLSAPVCKIDNIGDSITIATTSIPQLLGERSIGKHTLKCTVSYNETIGEETREVSDAISLTSVCSKIPNIKEK